MIPGENGTCTVKNDDNLYQQWPAPPTKPSTHHLSSAKTSPLPTNTLPITTDAAFLQPELTSVVIIIVLAIIGSIVAFLVYHHTWIKRHCNCFYKGDANAAARLQTVEQNNAGTVANNTIPAESHGDPSILTADLVDDIRLLHADYDNDHETISIIGVSV